MTWASVVLPVPGGPHRMADDSRSDSTSTRRGRPGPTSSSWPTRSSIRSGGSRAASGAWRARRSSAAAANRSMAADATGPAICRRPPRSTAVGAARSSDDQHELAGGAARLTAGVGVGGLLQRVGGLDVDPELAVFDQLGQSEEALVVGLDQEPRVAGAAVADLGGQVARGGRGDVHEQATGAEAAGEVGAAAHQVQHDVDLA